MFTLAVTVTNQCRTFISKAGNEVTFTTVYIHLPGLPFPEKVDVFGRLTLQPGEYKVPATLKIQDQRLVAELDYSQAKSA